MPGSTGDPSRELVAFGRALRELREDQGMSTAELAEAAGLDRERVEAIEAARSEPDYFLILDLAEGLGVQPRVLLLRAEEGEAL